MPIDWQRRENTRFNSNEYKPLPFAYGIFQPHDHPDFAEKNPEFSRALLLKQVHYAHVSIKDPRLVSFTESPEKGARDIQTCIKAGKYIKRYHPGVPDAVITYFATLMNATAHIPSSKNQVKFAKTAAQIERVYVNGPHSCMSHSSGGNYASSVHPVRAYAGPDLAIAYIEDLNGKPMARCVVWPDKKRYSRIYGDGGPWTNMLRGGLEEMQYRRGPMIGARLTAIKEELGYVCPHIDDDNEDGEIYVSPTACGKYLRIVEEEECDGDAHENMSAKIQHGVAGMDPDDIHYCDYCDERICIPGSAYCAECDENMVECEACKGIGHIDSLYEIGKNDEIAICEQCYYYNEDVLRCSTCNTKDLLKNLKTITIKGDVGFYCEDCIPVECHECGNAYMKDAVKKMGKSLVCHNCCRTVYHKCNECAMIYHDADEDEDTEGVCKECTKEAA